MARPEGIILVTGPTGSGKTTTLYSMLTHINTVDVNIMTLEDPVEYPMTMIRQTSINDNVKLGFADGIRTLMRQDPDIILVGEIRDADTAEMAFRAAMTGHQVFSTLHTNSAIGTISRLVDIGVSPEVLSGNIIGVLGQRLIRKLCTFCKEAYQPEPFEKMILGLDDEDNTSLYKAKGCPKCKDIGYKGRTSLLEVLKIDADMDELIAQRATQKVLLEYAQSKGFRRLADDGIRRVIEGITSLEEISRVIDLTDRI
jgi:type II secretory ATPase GspE/PulE/Tfp pilus assembly ATPase PilB-like protein